MQVERSSASRGIRLSEVSSMPRARISLREDWDEVLGGGAVTGSIVLVSGAPGAGKTSDCLALAERGGSYDRPSLYLASEWKAKELAARMREIGLEGASTICEEVDTLEACADAIGTSSARVIVLDSWGMLSPPPEALDTLRAVLGSAVLFVVLHATKDEDFAGGERLLHKANALIWVDPHELTVRKNWHGPPELVVKRQPENFRGI
jgi:DNA repair protein RadA/Sms